MIKICSVLNPFDLNSKEIIEAEYIAVASLRSYVESHTDFIRNGTEIKVAVNSGIIGEEEWSKTYISDGDIVTICPVVEGGDGGGVKSVMGAVLGVALAVVSMGVGSVVAGGAMFGSSAIAASAWGWAAWAACAATMYLGGMLLNHVIGTSTVDIGSADFETSQTYSWDAAATHSTQGDGVPVTFGTVKVTNNNVISSHVLSNGEDQYYHILCSGGEGPIDSISDVRINDNPISNYDDVSYETRLGSYNQAEIALSGDKDQYADKGLSYELDAEHWSTELLEGNTTQGIEVTVNFPNGMYYANDDGSLGETSVRICVQYRPAGGSWASLTGNEYETVSAASSDSFYRVYSRRGLTQGSYEVRCRIASKDGTTSRYCNRCYWIQVSSIIYDQFTYPGIALVGIRAKATSQLSGGSPTITWKQTRNYVLVYDPYQKKYVNKPATNPAWICYDLLHWARKNPDGSIEVNGCSKELLLYDDFNGWASACSSRGMICNWFFDASSDLDKALKSPCTAGRGTVVRRGTKFGAIWDRVSTPVQLFSVGNIIQGSFKLDYLPIDSRANAVEITFNNERKDYERDSYVVFAEDYDSSDKTSNPTQLSLDCITDPSLIYREGKYYLRQNQYLLTTATWKASADAIVCQPGDVVLVQHDVPDWGQGGRVMEVSANSFKMDKKVSLINGKTYEVTVRKSNDSIFKHTFKATKDEETDIIPVGSSSGISQYDVYAFGVQNISSKPFTVVSVQRSGDTEFTISGLEYNEKVYNEATYIDEIDYSNSWTSSSVSGLELSEETYRNSQGVLMSYINAKWRTNGGHASLYKVYQSTDARSWSLMATVQEKRASIKIPSTARSHCIKVEPCNILGKTCGDFDLAWIVTYRTDNAPAAVTGLTAEVSKGGMYLKWNSSTERDIAGYNVYYEKITSTRSISTASKAYSLISTTHCTVSLPESGNYRFYVYAQDYGRNVSAPAYVDASISFPDNVTNFTCNDASGGFNLSWDLVANDNVDGADDIVGYNIYCESGSYYSRNLVVRQHSGDSIYVSCDAGGLYKFYIEAEDIKGNTSSVQASVTGTYISNKPEFPEIVTGFICKDATGGFRLEWDKLESAGLLGYNIYQSFNNEPYKIIARSCTNNYLYVQAEESGQYRFYIVAINTDGVRSKNESYTSGIYSKLGAVIPDDVIGLSCKVASGGLCLKWEKVRNDDIEGQDNIVGYNVYYKKGTNTGTFSDYAIINRNYTGSRLYIPLEESGEYSFCVVAVNIEGDISENPAYTSGTYQGIILDPPANVEGFVNTVTVNGVNLDWTPVPRDNEYGIDNIIGYNIYKSFDGGEYTLIGNEVSGSHLNVPLSVSGVYVFYIVAVDTSGRTSETPAYTERRFTAVTINPPENVNGIRCERVEGGFYLTWSPVSVTSTDELANSVTYKVYMRFDDYEYSCIEDGYLGTSLFIAASEIGAYYFYIEAIDSFGRVSSSPPVVVGKIERPLLDAESFTAIKNGDNINFQWNAEESDNECLYEIRIGDSWINGNPVVSKLASDHYSLYWPSIGEVTFWLKACSKYGDYSESCGKASVTMAYDQNYKLIRKVDQREDNWPGDKVIAEVKEQADGKKILAYGTGPVGEYNYVVDLGETMSVRNWIYFEQGSIGSALKWKDINSTWKDFNISWSLSSEESIARSITYISQYKGIDREKYYDVINMNGNSNPEINNLVKVTETGVSYEDTRYGKGAMISDRSCLEYNFSTTLTKKTGTISFNASHKKFKGGLFLYLRTDNEEIGFSQKEGFFYRSCTGKTVSVMAEYAEEDTFTITVKKSTSSGATMLSVYVLSNDTTYTESAVLSDPLIFEANKLLFNV